MYDQLVTKFNAIQIIDATNLVKKNWLWHKSWGNWKKKKINYDHTKYFTIQEFAKLTAETFTAS